MKKIFVLLCVLFSNGLIAQKTYLHCGSVFDSKSGKLIIAVDPRYFRPTEVDILLGDSSNAKEKLGWETKISLKEMVHEMMENDLGIAKRDELVKKHGYKAPNYHE